MGKFVFAIIAVVASFMLVDSLTCNRCSYGVLGFCLASSELTCTNATDVCFTSRATFVSISSVGFNTQGCRALLGCNANTTGELVGIPYTTRLDCCATDRCNPLKIGNGASSAKMSLTAAIGVAVLASMCGSFL